MVLLVDDVGEAHDQVISEAQRAGIRVVRVAVGGLRVLTLAPADLEELLDHVKALSEGVLYVTAPWTDEARRLAGQELEDAEPLFDASMETDPTLAPALRRQLTLFRDRGFADFWAGFARQGILHLARVADRAAWPAIEESDAVAAGAPVERSVADVAPIDILDAPPDMVAASLMEYLEDEGHTPAEMRRNPARLARLALTAVAPDPHDLDAEDRKRLRTLEKEVERRLRHAH